MEVSLRLTTTKHRHTQSLWHQLDRTHELNTTLSFIIQCLFSAVRADRPLFVPVAITNEEENQE